MSLKTKFVKFMNISLLKTLVFNIHCFGWGGVIRPRFIVSKNVLIKNKGQVHVNGDGKIWLGFGEIGFVDKKRDRVIWDNNGEITFMGKAALGPGVKIVCMGNGHIQFGDDFSCNANTKIICKKKISFGNDVMISWDCTFLDTDFHKVIIDGEQSNADKEIIVGNHVWIGSETLVLKGAFIPHDTVIAARSTISRRLHDSNCIYHDNECIKQNINWEH